MLSALPDHSKYRAHPRTYPTGLKYFLACLLAVAFGVGCDNQQDVKKPNIILITLDTTRADHLGTYGYNKNTSPNIDQLAQEAVIYERAIATGTWTLPSHASLFTGKFPSSHGAQYDTNGALQLTHGLNGPAAWDVYRARPLAVDEKTLAGYLSDIGYLTGGFAGGPWLKSIFGLDAGFDYYNDENITELNGRSAKDLTNAAIKWLNTESDKPRFLFLNYFDPHGPLVPPLEHARQFLPRLTVGKDRQLTLGETLGKYDGEIHYMDHHLGRLFDHLKFKEIYDETWIIITGDHGELFGEHGHNGHGNRPYQEVVHVPLIIKYPQSWSNPTGQDKPEAPGPPAASQATKLPGKQRIRDWVQLTDVFAMILAHFEIPPTDPRQADVPPDIKHPIIIESRTLPFESKGDGHWLAMIDDGMKFIWNSNGRHMLFDLDSDPQENNNLLIQYPVKAERMQATMNQYLDTLPEPGRQPIGQVVDPETLNSLRNLGYTGNGPPPPADHSNHRATDKTPSAE